EARRWPELMAIIEDKVRPFRQQVNRARHRQFWWQFGETRSGLVKAVKGLRRVLVACIVSNKPSFAFLPANMVFSHKLVVFPLDSFAAFALLQSRIHDLWARMFSSTMKDDLNYAPADCFETFPFPPDWTTSPALEAAGQAYYDFRAALMVRNNQGLTATYNRFHDPDETDPDILELRRLHAAMDRAVLDAYGWTDIPTDCEFRLDYEDPEDEDDDPASSPRRKKKPWRFRWPEAVHDEVLARLLALNQERAEAERKLAAPEKKARPTAAAPRRGRAKKGAAPPAPDLFTSRKPGTGD
ncbi:MAG: class I SAM-dependent DNA methyltransferase, partial [Dehalococcoidia bacterium]|nr:class I SAM-dependent DNA methyltransferase [Dehalococcoidia bacterium]